GEGMVVLIVFTNRTFATTWRGPLISTTFGSMRMVTGPGGPTVDATSIAECTRTGRVQVDSKRSVMLRGSTSRTTASTPSGSATSSGRKSRTSVSGALAEI